MGALLVYDITKEKSFRNAQSWAQSIRENADPNVVIMLLGNKNDLPDRQVSRADGQQLAQQLGASFEEISALNSNVNVVFEKLCASNSGCEVGIAERKVHLANRNSTGGVNLNS